MPCIFAREEAKALPARLRIGELLVNAGLLSTAQLEGALDKQRAQGTTGVRLGTVLVEQGLVTETQLAKVLSQQLSVPWVSLHHIDFSRQLLNLVPRALAEEFCLIPVYVRHERKAGETLYLAMDDPTHDEALRRVTASSGLAVKAMIASPTDIRAAIRTFYAPPLPEPPLPGAGSVLVPSISSGASPVVVSAANAGAGASPAKVPAAEALDEPFASNAPPPPSPPSASPAQPPRTASVRPPAPAAASTERAPTAAESRAARRDSVAPPDPTPARTAAPRKQRMISLTLLDGTTIQIPAQRRRLTEEPPAPETAGATEHGDRLTTHDLVAALRAVAHGADPGETLGDTRWESVVAALLTLLMKKQLITDWEFAETLAKM